MLEIKKLKDFMKERGIQEGEQFAMLPLTNWYMFDDCFGQIIGLFDEQELNENYIVLTDRPFKLKFEDILEKYHFEDGEIIENCIENLAVVKGRPKLCYKINCNDCDFKLVQKGCHNKVKDWLKQTHIKPTYKLTKFEKDLLQCYSSGHKFGLFNSLIGMKEKGYFKCIDENEEIDYILANCEVVG